MKISVYVGDNLAFTVNTKAVNEESFSDLMRQVANRQLGKWAAQTPQIDHKIEIKEVA